jgi:hypothetical protein
MALQFYGTAGPQKTPTRSLRFNAADSTSLSRTPVFASNRTTFTVSFWTKRTDLSNGTRRGLFSAGPGANRTLISWNDNNELRFDTSVINRISNAVFRDTSEWYHIVVGVDTNQATANNRIRMYVNGVEITSWSTISNPSLGQLLEVNNTTIHVFGYDTNSGGNYNSGLLSEAYLIDGLQLTPNAFGYFDGNRKWQPKQYAGSFGPNGFYLDFSDNSATTAATLGADRSGNGNNYTPTNFSVTAGVENDSLTDTPTNNYCILNINDRGTNAGIANGGLDMNSGANWNGARGTVRLPATGKWYWEQTTSGAASGTNGLSAGIANQLANLNTTTPLVANIWVLSSVNNNAAIYSNGTTLISSLPNYTASEVLRVAWNADTKQLWLGRAGGWYNSVFALTGDPTDDSTATIDLSAQSGPFFAWCQSFSLTQSLNFGQRTFNYTVPTGYLSINSTNLPDQVTINPAFQAKIFSGNGAAVGDRQFVELNFTPSMTWVRPRNQGTLALSSNTVSDIVRNNAGVLVTDATNAQTSPATTGLEQTTALNGFTVIRQTANARNNSTINYVAYNWLQSQNYGFEIISYVGDNTSNRLIQHSLGRQPDFMIVKATSTTSNWYVWHRNFSSNTHFTTFGSIAESNTNSPWGTGIKTANTFEVTTGSNTINEIGARYCAYLFANISGICEFGTYVGNGSTDGTFVNLNFKPALVIIKNRSASEAWTAIDIARGGVFNPVSQTFIIGSQDVEATSTPVDFVSNGFKLRVSGAAVNTSGGNYVYCAWSEAAFKSSRAR